MAVAIISHPDCLLHNMGNDHPERPDRIRVIENTLLNSEISELLEFYEAPLATRDHLLLAHHENYINNIFTLAPTKGLISLDPDTYMNPYTLNAALRAAGAAIKAVDLVMSDKITKVFCNIRPPGHHAERGRAMGFCFFNNVAIGIMYALKHYHLKRIAIVDFDVHHGNGTQDIFQTNPKVLLCSSFQYPFYPNTDISDNSHIIHVPLAAGTDGKEFRIKIERSWFDPIRIFKPQLIFFSAGFDAHYQDPIANLNLNELDYQWLTQQVNEIAEDVSQGRTISLLEGGYSLNMLGQCVVAHIKGLLF